MHTALKQKFEGDTQSWSATQQGSGGQVKRGEQKDELRDALTEIGRRFGTDSCNF